MRDHVKAHRGMSGGTMQRNNGGRRNGQAKSLLTLVAAAAAGLIGHDAYAANASWLGTTNGNWSTSTNWSAATPTTGNTATFNGAGNGNTTIDIDSGRVVTSIAFTTNAVSYTIGSGVASSDDTLALVSGGNVSILVGLVNTGLTETINAPLSLGGSYAFTNAQAGAGSRLVFAGNITNSATSTLTLSGAGTGSNLISGIISNGSGGTVQTLSITATLGTWEITGNNSYSGGTTLSGSTGTVQIGHNSALGGGNITFTAGKFQAGTAVSLSNTSTLTAQTFQGSQNIGLSGKMTISAGGNRTLTSSITGGGTLTLGAIDLAPAGDIDPRTHILAGTGNTTISGIIANGGTVANGLTINNTGVTKLSGTNTYSGLTTLGGASNLANVQIDNNAAFGTGDIKLTNAIIEAVNAPRTLANNISELNGGTIQGSQNLTFNGMTKIGASATRTLDVTNSAATTFANVGLTHSSGAATFAMTGTGAVNINGVVSNGGGGTFGNAGNTSNLLYAGNNTVTLSGLNTYSGFTTIKSGTIEVNSLANGGKTSFTITTTSGSTTATVSSTTGLVAGQTIITVNQGSGDSSLQVGTTIASIVDATTITLSQAATTVTGTTVTAFAGTPNSLGMSTNVAANLNFNGGTLKYTGGATSTDRLFTLSGGGGTIDSSGSGLLSFTNTGTISPNPVSHVSAVVTSGSNTVTFGTTGSSVNTADLAVGMTVTNANIPANTTITAIGPGFNTFTLSNPASATNAATTLAFTGGPARTLTLTGTNAGSLASILADPAGTTTSLSKTGGGNWSLKGASTYSGGTAVSNGTLFVDNTSGSGTGTGAVAVSGSGTKLGGSGTIAPGASNGVTVGTGSFVTPGGNSAGNTLASLKLDGAGTSGTLLTMNTGAKFFMELSAAGGGTVLAPAASDTIVILNAAAGDVVFNNTVIDLTTAAVTADGYYKLFDTDGGSATWSGLTLDGQMITGGLTLGTIPVDPAGSQLFLGDGLFGDAGDIYVSVPEPTSVSGLVLGGLCVLRRRRCKQKQSIVQ